MLSAGCACCQEWIFPFKTRADGDPARGPGQAAARVPLGWRAAPIAAGWTGPATGN
jgi:hypothetical protein